jgi:hypothetical protein
MTDQPHDTATDKRFRLINRLLSLPFEQRQEMIDKVFRAMDLAEAEDWDVCEANELWGDENDCWFVPPPDFSNDKDTTP